MEHERHPLARRQPFEHDEQRRADRVGQDRLLLGAGIAARWFGRCLFIKGLFGPRPARSQPVKADARHNGRQPGTEVVDGLGIGALKSQPRLLDRVLGFGVGPEQPVGERVQPGSVGLEPVGDRATVVHQYVSTGRISMAPP